MHNTWEIIKDTGNAQPNAEFDLANREIREASIAAVQGTNFLSSSFYHIDSGSTRMKDQLIVNGVYSLSLCEQLLQLTQCELCSVWILFVPLFWNWMTALFWRTSLGSPWDDHRDPEVTCRSSVQDPCWWWCFTGDDTSMNCESNINWEVFQGMSFQVLNTATYCL